VLIVATAISFLRWLHSAVRQAQALQINVDATPGWAVGYWFIPFANLVKPFHVIRKLLAGLGGEDLVTRSRVGAWWGMWITGNVLSQIQSRLAMSNGLEAPAPSSSYVVGILASSASIAGALLCIQVLRTAQAALDSRRP
jgi:hypothetical protein